MAETTTVNYGWTKPDPGGSPNTWGTTLNATTDKVDAKVYANEQGLSPIGAITMYAGAAAPANWLLCNGATLSRAAPYDKLFAVLGTAFNVGTVAADKFMLPNLVQKFPLGAGSGQVGAVGGSFAVGPAPNTFAIANMPAHAHTATEAAHTHPASQAAHSHVITTGNHQHAITTGSHSHALTQSFGLSYTVPGGGGSQGVTANVTAVRTDTAGNLGGSTDIAGNLSGYTDSQAPAVTVAANTPPAITVATAGSGTAFNVVPPFIALNYIVRYI